MFWIIVAYICTLMMLSLIRAHVLRITDYVLSQPTMIYGKFTTGLMLMDFV